MIPNVAEKEEVGLPDTTTKRFSPDDVITALLYYLPREFNNDPEKIHRTIYALRKKNEYKDLLGSFEFIAYSRFPYSPLLGRVFNRLQESRLLSSRNPGYIVYETKKKSMDAIKSYYLDRGKVLHKYRGKLKEIAKGLERELRSAEL